MRVKATVLVVQISSASLLGRSRSGSLHPLLFLLTLEPGGPQALSYARVETAAEVHGSPHPTVAGYTRPSSVHRTRWRPLRRSPLPNDKFPERTERCASKTPGSTCR